MRAQNLLLGRKYGKWSPKIWLGITDSQSPEELGGSRRILLTLFSLGQNFIIRLMSDLFHACLMQLSSSELLWFKQLSSANNGIPGAVVWKRMRVSSFSRGCLDVLEGSSNVLQDYMWLCDTRMRLRCSLEMVNKQPLILLHVYLISESHKYV